LLGKMAWGMIVRVAMEAFSTFASTFVQAWRHVAAREPIARSIIGLSPNKKMTVEEAKKILSLEKGPLTLERIQQRFTHLYGANDSEGSLFLRHKVNIARRVLEENLPQNQKKQR